MSDLTIKNRILSALCNNGPMSRAELSKRFGLSSSHVSEAANELIEKGVLTNAGYRTGENSRGRKNILLDLNPSYKFALGIGFAGNILSIGLTTVKGDVLGKEIANIDLDIPKDELFETALSMTMRILRDCCLNFSSLLGIGLCADEITTKTFYFNAPYDVIANEVSKYSGHKVVYESADEYLQFDQRIAVVRPEELYIFGAAKVIRDLLLYGEV